MLRGLYARLVLSLAVGLVLTVAPFGWWVARRQAHRHVDGVRENARIVTRALAEDTAHFLVIADYAGLEQQLLAGATLPGVQSIHLFETDGRLVANVHREREGAAPRARYVREERPIPTGDVPRVDLHEDRLVVWAPIEAGRRLGWLETSWSLAAVDSTRATIGRQTAALGAAWLGVNLVIVSFVLRRPMGAIRQLSLFARDLARRKGERLRGEGGAEEIRLLADSLDHASVELAKADRRAAAEYERLAVTLQSLGEGVIACDREGRVTLVNGEAERILGRTASELIGRRFEQAVQAVDARTGEPLPISLAAAIDVGHAVEPAGSPAVVRADGARCRISDEVAPIVDEAGMAVGAVVVLRDETERLAAAEHERTLEEQLRHAQRMEAMGMLAGGIAHDFNNVLTGILGYGSLLLELTPAGDARREPAEELVQAAHRAATLTRGLLAFSRKGKAELRLVDLNEIVRGVQRMLARIIGEDVAVASSLSGGPLVVDADAAQLEQVLMNLATNARDAMPSGGRFTIATSRVDLEEPVATLGGAPLRGPCARIEVSDTGTGIDDATLQRIFEPFYTTKEIGRGTGLGLSIVEGIVRQHGGALAVESRRGVGTTFRIQLPLDAGTPSATDPGEEAAPRGGTERILLVEDDAEVRRVTQAILERAGYRVTEALNGQEALRLAELVEEPFELVISDVVMPRMSGRELGDALRTRHPSLPVLFASGYTPEALQDRLQPDAEVLPKPFTARALLGKVRHLLDRAAERASGERS